MEEMLIIWFDISLNGVIKTASCLSRENWEYLKENYPREIYVNYCFNVVGDDEEDEISLMFEGKTMIENARVESVDENADWRLVQQSFSYDFMNELILKAFPEISDHMIPISEWIEEEIIEDDESYEIKLLNDKELILFFKKADKTTSVHVNCIENGAVLTEGSAVDIKRYDPEDLDDSFEYFISMMIELRK